MADNCPVERPCKEKTGEEIVLIRSFFDFCSRASVFLVSIENIENKDFKSK